MVWLPSHQKRFFLPIKSLLEKTKSHKLFTVLDIPENRVGAKLVDIYRKNETPAEAYAHLELLKLSKEHYRKNGTGRPTKKDRRDIDEFGNEIKTEEETD